MSIISVTKIKKIIDERETQKQKKREQGGPMLQQQGKR